MSNDKNRSGEALAESLDNLPGAYDPMDAPLDLTRDEKRRTTALMLAIQAYRDQIIKDADYLRESVKLDEDRVRRGERPRLQSTTMDAVVEAAIKFERFIAGQPVPQGALPPPADVEGDGDGPVVDAEVADLP